MLAQLSDPHIRLTDGGEAAAALRRAVGAVSALDPAPDAVLVSGDLADTGDPREYALVEELLRPLAMPVHVLPGNHDDVPALEAVFGPAEYAVDAGPLRLVAVDTSIPGQGGGRIAADRLRERLGDQKPTIVAMHHAPLTTGIPPMDRIGISAADRAALADVLAQHPQVKRIVCGHLHRTIVGAVAGVPVFTCPGTHSQLTLDFNATEVTTNDDPPGYALHILRDGEVITHVVLL